MGAIIIRAIAFAWYAVRDMKRARAFHEGTLGLRLARREVRDFELVEYDLEGQTFEKQNLDEAGHWHCAK
jgi:catechol 2,3-dioxygenase-like lactoylglutathione lyase family enzyme